MPDWGPATQQTPHPQAGRCSPHAPPRAQGPAHTLLRSKIYAANHSLTHCAHASLLGSHSQHSTPVFFEGQPTDGCEGGPWGAVLTARTIMKHLALLLALLAAWAAPRGGEVAQF